jgi:hypothetical protein
LSAGISEKRRQTLHFEFVVKMSNLINAPNRAGDGPALSVLDRLAKDIDSGAHECSTSNAEALAAWGRGDFETAVKLDPDFGAAWLAWVEARSAEDAQQTTEIVQRALGQPALKSPVDRARLELASAPTHDDPPQRAGSLAKFMPNDGALLRQLANQEMNARQFAQSRGSIRMSANRTRDIESGICWDTLRLSPATGRREIIRTIWSDPVHAANV